MQEVRVCDKIPDFIIDADFIQKHKLAYHLFFRSVHWYNEPHAPVLTLQAETTFEPLKTMLITTKLYGQSVPFAHHVASIFSFEDRLIQGGPSLVSVSDDGLCTVAVQNYVSYLITIKNGSGIGLTEIEGVHSKIELLSQTKLTEII